MSRSPRRSPNVRVNVIKKAVHPQLPSAPQINRLVSAIMAAERPRYRGELNIVFVDRKTIRRLHKEYLDTDESTDVMAFPYAADDGDGVAFGDISICVPEALANARRFKDTPAREFIRLVIHGLLHLLGYDDHEPRKKTLMWAQQEKWVNAFSARGAGKAAAP